MDSTFSNISATSGETCGLAFSSMAFSGAFSGVAVSSFATGVASLSLGLAPFYPLLLIIN